MMGWIRRKRMFIASAILMGMFLCGCTTLLNGDLTVAYLTEEERAEIARQGGVQAVMNYHDEVFNPQVYDSEYPDAFYIPENYSKEPQDIRGFELLDFVNGDTFIYAYQTMVYRDTGTAPSVVPVSGDYVFCENSVTKDTRELSGEMVTVLAANRYTAQRPGEGYRELRCWSSEATDNQTFFANAVGELGKGLGEQAASIGSYAVYFNGHAVIYQASEVREALKKNTDLKPLIEYQFSDVIQEIIEEIMIEEGINPRNGQQYQFDITDVSFSVGVDCVDIYMTVTQSKEIDKDELAEEAQRVSQNSGASVSYDEEVVDESQYGVTSYDIRMGFYKMDRDFSCTIQNTRCGEQIRCFQTNGSNMPIDFEWDVSDNKIHFLTKEDVLWQCSSQYSNFFLKDDNIASDFAYSEKTGTYDECAATNFSIDGYRITGRLQMTGQTYREAVRQGYYMDGDQWVESDMRASFIQSRSFTLENPMVLAYCWERQKVWDERQYSRCFVLNGIRADYAVYLPKGDLRDQVELTDSCWSGRNYNFNLWEEFCRWFTGQKDWNGRQRIDHIPAVNSITSKVSGGEAYIFCYTQDGIYLYGIEPEVKEGGLQFAVSESFYIDYSKLNVSISQMQNQESDSQMESIMQEYRESEIYYAGVDTGSLSVSAQTVLQREYNVGGTTPDAYPDYSINRIGCLWTQNRIRVSVWTVCTASHGLEILLGSGTPYIPVFQKNVIYEYGEGAENTSVSYYQQLTRLEEGVAAYAVFENQGEDKGSYPFLLLGYDYQGAVYTDMDIARAKVIPFTILEPDRMVGTVVDEAWERVTADPGDSRVFYLKDCYDRSLYGTVSVIPGYKEE